MSNPQQLLQSAKAAHERGDLQTAYNGYETLLQRHDIPWTDHSKQQALLGMDALNNANYRVRAKQHKFTGLMWCNAALQVIGSLQGTLASSTDPDVKLWLNKKLFS